MRLGSITMILRTEGGLWNTVTNDHQHQRNSKPKPLLEKLYWLYSGTLKVLCSPSPWKKLLQCTQNNYWNPKKSQKTHHEEGAEIDDVLPQQDNSRPHKSATTTDATACLGFTVLPYPTNSPYLAPSDFHLFPKLKETSRVKTSVLMKKSRLQSASCFGKQEKTVLRTEFKTC